MADCMRWIVFLLVFSAAAFAQEEEDDEIEIDTNPPAEEEDEAGESTPDRPKKPAATKGKKKGWLRFADKSGKYAIELPEAWNPEPFDSGRGLLGLRWRLAESAMGASLQLVEARTVRDPRSAPRYWRESFSKTYKDATIDPRYRPLPHLHWQGEERAGAVVFLQIKGNGFYVQFECAVKEYAQMEADVMAAAATVTADVAMWPAIPEGYVAEQKGSFLVARHPSVKSSPAFVKKLLKAAEKQFKKKHGTLPPTDRPIVVLVHRTQKQAGAILKEAGEATGISYADFLHRRIFTLPLAKGDTESAIGLVGTTHLILALAKYGDTEPQWFRAGERELARATFATGKPLPFMYAGFANWTADVKIGKLDALLDLPKEQYEQVAKQSFFYVCMFHAGKYKKAYKRFLKDYAENHDPDAAFKRHLLPIGYEKLREATMNFAFNKMRPVKPKK